MQAVYLKLILLFCVCCLMPYYGLSRKVKVTRSNSFISSPRIFDSNDIRYVMRQPNDSFITVIKFSVFRLGRKPESLVITENRLNDPSSRRDEFFGVKDPFTYVSRARKVHVVFNPYHRRKLARFVATVYFLNNATYCDFTFMNTNLSHVTSCQNQVDNFATQCRVECENPSENRVAKCKSGFLPNVQCTEYCDFNSFQFQNATLTSCQNISNSRASRCQFSCDRNYVGGGTAICYNQRVIADVCKLHPVLAKRCEDQDFENCPYSFSEMMSYYEDGQFTLDPFLSKEEDDLLQAEIDALPEPEIDINERAVGRSIGVPYWKCLHHYCRTKTWVNGAMRFKYSCKRFRSQFKRVLCFICRHQMKCRRPVPETMFR